MIYPKYEQYCICERMCMYYVFEKSHHIWEIHTRNENMGNFEITRRDGHLDHPSMDALVEPRWGHRGIRPSCHGQFYEEVTW